MGAFLQNRATWLLILALLSFCIVPSSSLGQITFEKTYGGSNWDEGYSAQQTIDGGCIITGYTHSFGAGGPDVYLIKTDSLGNAVWETTYGGSGNDYGRSLQETLDGGYIVAGETGSFGAGSGDVYLIKVDSLGNTLWVNTYGGVDDDEGHSVMQTLDDGYIVAGETESFGAGGGDVYLVKTDSLGNALWEMTYGGSSLDYGKCVRQTVDGGYIITGETYSSGPGISSVYLIRTDSLGNLLWEATYGGGDSEYGSCVQQTSDGGYVITGRTQSFGAGNGDVYVVRIDSLGNALWDTTYGGPFGDRGTSIQCSPDNSYVISGDTWSFGSGWSDVYLIKTDSLGITLWERTHGGGQRDYGRCVKQTSDGGYVIGGSTRSFGAGEYDVYLIKTDPDGYVGVEEERRRPGVQSPGVVVLQNTPNPFHHNTMIDYSIPVYGSVTLRVYDVTGRLVETLVEERQEPGVYQVQWETQESANGIYFCRLDVREYSATVRMILLR